MLLWTLQYICLFELEFLSFLDICPGVRLLDHMGKRVLFLMKLESALERKNLVMMNLVITFQWFPIRLWSHLTSCHNTSSFLNLLNPQTSCLSHAAASACGTSLSDFWTPPPPPGLSLNITSSATTSLTSHQTGPWSLRGGSCQSSQGFSHKAFVTV